MKNSLLDSPSAEVEESTVETVFSKIAKADWNINREALKKLMREQEKCKNEPKKYTGSQTLTIDSFTGLVY